MAKRSLIGVLALSALLACSPAALASSPALVGPPGSCPASAGTTIASAGALTVGTCVSGGGGSSYVEFWKLSLTGGDRVQLTVQSAVALEFDLYSSDTTDDRFTAIRPVDVEVTSPVSGPAQVLTIQAPYSDTFVLAACEPVDYAANGGDCRGIFTGRGAKYTPMTQPYAFTSAAVGNACASPPLRAGSKLALGPALTIGACEAGGGNDIDYWTVALSENDQLELTVPPAAADVEFDLYSPGTTDAALPRTTPTDSRVAAATQGGATSQVTTLTAASAGTYVLAACEPKASATIAGRDCRGIATGSGAGYILPMKPYTFTTSTIPQPAYDDIGYGSTSYDFNFPAYASTASNDAPAYGKLSIARQTVSVSKNRALRLSIRCAGAPCTGKLTLTAVTKTRTANGTKHKTKEATVTVASTTLTSLDTGTTRVSLILTKAGRRVLRNAARGRLRATATLKYDTGTATKSAHATITLRAANT
jgi:hypothetical protein